MIILIQEKSVEQPSLFPLPEIEEMEWDTMVREVTLAILNGGKKLKGTFQGSLPKPAVYHYGSIVRD